MNSLLLAPVLFTSILIKTGGTLPSEPPVTPKPQYNTEMVKILLEKGEGTRILVGRDVEEEWIKDKAKKESKLYCFSSLTDFPKGITELVVKNGKLVFYVPEPKVQPKVQHVEFPVMFQDCPSCRRFR